MCLSLCGNHTHVDQNSSWQHLRKFIIKYRPYRLESKHELCFGGDYLDVLARGVQRGVAKGANCPGPHIKRKRNSSKYKLLTTVRVHDFAIVGPPDPLNAT
jgi:hypothetical protein